MDTEQTESEFCVPDELLLFSEVGESFDLQITDGGLRLTAKEQARKEPPRAKARARPELVFETAPPPRDPVRVSTLLCGALLAFGVPFTVVFVAGLGEAALRWMAR